MLSLSSSGVRFILAVLHVSDGVAMLQHLAIVLQLERQSP